MKRFAFLCLLACTVFLSGCRSAEPHPEVLTAEDEKSLQQFCDCASPFAAMTLMVMMEDTTSTSIDSLEVELASLSAKYEKCHLLVADVELRASLDSAYNRQLTNFILTEIPNCGALILGEANPQMADL